MNDNNATAEAIETTPAAKFEGVRATVADLRAAMKKADAHTYIHVEVDHAGYKRVFGPVNAVATLSCSPYRNPDLTHEANDRRTKRLDVGCYVANGLKDKVDPKGGAFNGAAYSKDEDNIFRPDRGFWSIFPDRLRDALAGLPGKAEVTFRIELDWYCSHQELVAARLHADQLFLRARWKEGRREYQREFLLEAHVSPHDVGRFGFERTTYSLV